MKGLVLTIKLPLPPAGASSNSRSHWSKGVKDKRDYRQAAELFCTQAIRGISTKTPLPFAKRVRVSSEWWLGRRLPQDGRYRPRDVQNAVSALKAAFDGVVDAQLVKDDSAQYFELGRCVLHSAKDSGTRGEVALTIEVLE